MSRRIKFDSNNFNRHTAEGMELLEKSIKEVGAIESIATDRNGEIITGNARKETFDKLGYKPKFIKLGENEYPVIETDLDGEKRVKASILANTVALKNIDLDMVKIKEAGVDLEEVGIDGKVEANEVKPEEIKFSTELDWESNYVVLKFTKDIDFLHVESLLGLESVYSKRTNGKPWSKGRGRVIDGMSAIEKIKKS